MLPLQFSLFGSPRLERDGTPLPQRRRKAVALFAYLAVSQQPQSRDTLAALFWPDFDQASARTNLRRDLSWLNKTLGKGILVASRAEVGVAKTAVFSLDVLTFQNKLAQVRQHHPPDTDLCPDCATTLREAIPLYTGDFMAGFTLPDATEFADWQFFQAERLRQELAWALQQLIGWQQGRGLYAEGVENGRLWVNLDPLHEPAQRALMTLYAQAGQHAAALRQYEECVRVLRAELGAEVEAETSVLYEAIRTRRLEAEGKRSGGAEERRGGGAGVIRQNLPAQATPFLGRREELATLAGYLAEPSKRLVTILGAGGMGKTRLALAVAEQQITNNQFTNGLFFVPLAPLSSPDQIIPTLAEALNFPLETGGEQRRTAKQQVLDYLRQKSMLLIFDNCEHLLAGMALVADILQTAPQVKIIATSRERLHLHQEQLFALQGLDAPQVAESEGFGEFTAVRLFLQSAQRVKHDFQLRPADQRWLVRICHLVGGMPLAVELAAGWVDTLSMADIAQEIQQGLDFLETDARNIPSRHRSIEAVFAGSWQRLSPAEQAGLPQLSIFRGGFTRQAVQTITDASLRTLSKLVAKSLLQYDQARNRYQVHELLRQYLAERLAEDGEQENRVRSTHSRYYLNALAQREAKLKGREQQTALAEIEADIENVRAAWQWGVSTGQIFTLLSAASSLGYFSKWRGRYQDGEQLFQLTMHHLRENDGENSLLFVQIISWLAVFKNINGQSTEAEALLQKALILSKKWEVSDPENRRNVAFVTRLLGELSLSKDLDIASEWLGQSLEHYQALGDKWGAAQVYRHQGDAQRMLASYNAATELLQQSNNLYKELGDIRSRISVLEILSTNGRYSGQPEQAMQYSQECYELAKQIGDKPSMAKALCSLAFSHGTGLGNYVQAVSLQEKSVAIYQDLGDLINGAIEGSRLGFLYSIVGSFHKGEEFLQENINILHQVNLPKWLGWSYQMLGVKFLARKNETEARRCLLEAESIYAHFGALDESLYGRPYLIFLERKDKSKDETYRALLDLQTIIYEHRLYFPQRVLFKVIAAVLAEEAMATNNLQGTHAKLAIELATLSNYYLSVSNLMFDKETIDKPTEQLKSQLPLTFVNQLVDKGRKADLWQTAAYLLEELPRLGWGTVG